MKDNPNEKLTPAQLKVLRGWAIGFPLVMGAGAFGLGQPFVPALWLIWVCTYVPATVLVIFFIYAIFRHVSSGKRGISQMIERMGFGRAMLCIIVALPGTALIFALVGYGILSKAPAVISLVYSGPEHSVPGVLRDISPFMSHWRNKKTVTVFLENGKRTVEFTYPLDKMRFLHCPENKIYLKETATIFGSTILGGECRQNT